LSDLAVGLASVGLGIFLAVGSLTIELGSGYDRIGPRFFPYLVAAGLMLTGGWLALSSVKRGDGGASAFLSAKAVAKADVETTADKLPLLWIGAGLLSSVVLFEMAGFILSSSVLFWMVARSFRSQRPIRDLGVAVVLSTLVYVAFTRGLGLVLPAGVLGWWT